MNRTFKYFLFFLYLTSCFLFISCRGRTGQAGPSGPDGSVLAVFQPGASPSAYYSGESDTYISSGSAYSGLNYGGSYSAPAGPYSGGFGTRRILIKFDISGSIPPGAVVTGADLELYCSYAGGSNTLTAYNLARSWMEGAGTGKAVPGATWNSDGTNPWAGGAYGAAAGTPVFCSTADENFFVDFPRRPQNRAVLGR